MDKEKILIKNTISVKDFCNLRESVNFQKLTEQQAEKVLKNTSAVVAVEYEGKYIGLTRILFDFGTEVYITDVIVHPDYQGFGIGGILIENAIDYLKKNAVEGVRQHAVFMQIREKRIFTVNSALKSFRTTNTDMVCLLKYKT